MAGYRKIAEHQTVGGDGVRANLAQEGIVGHLLGAEVRTCTLAGSDAPADEAQVALDEDAVPEQHVEEKRVADRLDDTVHSVVKAEQRVDSLLFEEKIGQARQRIDQRKAAHEARGIEADRRREGAGNHAHGSIPNRIRSFRRRGVPERKRVGRHRICERADNGEHGYELTYSEDPTTQTRRARIVGHAEVGRGLLGRRAVVALALGHALSALQRRLVAELAEIADLTINVEQAALADIGELAQANIPEM